jgi:hypothetical protein
MSTDDVPEVFRRAWLDLLDPAKLRPSLVRGGLYLCVYELLVEVLIAFPASLELDSHAEKYTQKCKFRLSVVPLSIGERKNALRSSWQWWKRQGALSDEDEQSFDSTEDYRHELAHEAIARLLLDDEAVWRVYFQKMICLIVKIDDWWQANADKVDNGNVQGTGRRLRETLLLNRRLLIPLIDAAMGDVGKAYCFLKTFQTESFSSEGA